MLLSSFSKFIYNRIISYKDFKNRAGFVIIGGAPAVGKTLICKNLQLNEMPIYHVEIESYFFHSREQRRNLGFNGFDIESYNVNLMKKHFEDYLNDRDFAIHKYDHDKGFLSKKCNISPKGFIAYEGFAFLSLLKKYQEYCIACYFIYPDDIGRWMQIHIDRDLKERHTPINLEVLEIEIKKKAGSLLNSFLKLNKSNKIVQYIRLEYGEKELLNKYLIADNVEGEAFLNELKYI